MKVERAEAELLQMIESGRFGVTGRLPPERELCAQLAISRSTLRRVLDMLEAKGKIWRHVGRGTFAGSRPVEAIRGLVAIGEATSPAELMELRLMIEPQIARLAAMRATRAEITYMQHCVTRSEAAADSKTYELWDGTLHHAIAKATRNSLIVSAFEAVNQLRHLTTWGRLRDRIVSPRERMLHWCRQHRAFVNAIANRDAGQAEHLARVHVEDVFECMSKLSQSQPDKAG
jgi:DNA-binding FadR family transcriptional regulator